MGVHDEGKHRDEGRAPVRVGVGGWVFEAWRHNFYPPGLPQKRELEYASRQLGSIEINATYYRLQTPASFARWRSEVPEDFVFSVKGPRYATDRKVLAEAGPAMERFFASGVTELADKLGPINWQFPPHRRFDPGDFEAFLGLLPRQVGGIRLRHAVEVRHHSFEAPRFGELLRNHDVALVLHDDADRSAPADPVGPFVYARLRHCSEDEPCGYPSDVLDAWAERALAWSSKAGHAEREVFLYIINGFKPKAPAAATALIARLAGGVTR